MSFFNCPTKYIGFDDRKFIILGVIIVSFITHPLMTELTFRDFLNSPKDIATSLLWTGTYWIVLRACMVTLRKKFDKINDTPKRLLLSTIIVVVTTPLISFLLGAFCNHILKYDIPIQTFNKYVLIYVLAFGVLAFYEATFYFYQYRNAIQETERLKTIQVQSQLDNLRNQISPHFLFNSLNTLMNLIPKDQDKAMSYLSKLSKFYRYTVSHQDETLISITTEIENSKTFADLLKERFGENISIEIDCMLGNGKMILPLSLQLLIENAVKHNIVSKSKPLNIKIYCTDDNYIHIENNLQRKIQAVSSTGIGLDNIKKRFAYLTDREVIIKESTDQYLISLPLINK